MNSASTSLLDLLKGLQTQLATEAQIPLKSICDVSSMITTWARNCTMDTLDTRHYGTVSHLMELVGQGMTGHTEDAKNSLRTLGAALPMLISSVSKSLDKAA
jgi:hypothetical protein